MLDLEDSVPSSEKERSRHMVKESIPVVARGGAYVLVRINDDPSFHPLDVEASIHPGFDGILLPKTESIAEVQKLEIFVEQLEVKRGIVLGHIKFNLLIESPRGLLNAQEIAAASPRIESMSISPEDCCLELVVEPSSDGMELLFPSLISLPFVRLGR